MTIKKFLFSTVLTATVFALPLAASAEQKQNKSVQHKLETETKKTPLVNASGLTAKVGGEVDIQYGFVDQDKAFKGIAKKDGNVNKLTDKVPSNNALVSHGELQFSGEKEHCGSKYGFELNVNANTSKSVSGDDNFATKAFIYMENDMGRVEVGTEDGASEAMGISAATIAKATGGIDGDYSNWAPNGAYENAGKVILNDTFLNSPALPYASQHAKKANKISYYSPRINGFKAGVSYVPDVTVKGTTYEVLSEKSGSYKDVFELGLSYEQKFDNMMVTLAATGQVGETRKADGVELKRLGAWQVGGKVAYDSFTFAASYGDWGHSGLKSAAGANDPKKEAKFWTAGVAYDQKDLYAVSLTYMGSHRQGVYQTHFTNSTTPTLEDFNKAKQKYHAVSLGAEYNAMPNLTPYAEVTHFKYESEKDKQALGGVTTNKGTVFLGGVKLKF